MIRCFDYVDDLRSELAAEGFPNMKAVIEGAILSVDVATEIHERAARSGLPRYIINPLGATDSGPDHERFIASLQPVRSRGHGLGPRHHLLGGRKVRLGLVPSYRSARRGQGGG